MSTTPEKKDAAASPSDLIVERSEPFTFHVTKFTAHNPARLSKRFSLAGSANSELKRESGGQLIEGEAERIVLENLADFAGLLGRLNPGQALSYGVADHDKALVATKDALKRAGNADCLPTIARTRDHLKWPPGAGIFMLDHDPVKEGPPLTQTELCEALYLVCPALRAAPHLWRPSAGSCLVSAESGEELRGIQGQRIYALVKDASDIPRAGAVLFARLWLAGFGWYTVSASGVPLPRSLIDASVWQPERLDFAGGADCKPPVQQRLPDPTLFNPDATLLDTAVALPDLSKTERDALEKLQQAAREAVADEAARKREAWIAARVADGLQRDPGADTAVLRENYSRAVNEGRLLADFTLISEQWGAVTVGEILDNPEKFHNTRFADPMEPDYNNDQRISWANLRAAGRPYLWSHAHGGNRYTLHRQLHTIELMGGELHTIVERALELLRLEGAIFERGKELVYVVEGLTHPVTAEFLRVHLGSLARFVRFDGRKKTMVSVDCPRDLAVVILARRGFWKLPELRGILDAPVLLPDGRLIAADGYDAASGLLLELPDYTCGVLDHPTLDDARRALRTLWLPFGEFPFAGAVDRGVMLSTLLTACMRPVLPTAPATLFDAPTAGSGKSLLAGCVGILAGLPQPEVMPAASQEDELRKRLLAVARACKPVMVIDNIVGHFESAALCAFLTAETYSDRVLGQSVNLSFPNISLLLLTGNNVLLTGDLNRRVLRCRIDPQLERPDKRAFALNPIAYVKAHRLQMVEAALTLLRAYQQHGQPSTPDRTASFEDWSDSIRQAVIWTNELGVVEVADSVDSIDAGFALDPETQKLAALLSAWSAAFDGRRATVADAMRRAEALRFQAGSEDVAGGLYDALYEIAGEGHSINARRLGRWIERHAGRIVGGKRFMRDGNFRGVAFWLAR